MKAGKKSGGKDEERRQTFLDLNASQSVHTETVFFIVLDNIDLCENTDFVCKH